MSTEILESMDLVMDNKEVIDVLKDSGVTENIIFESEVGVEEDGEEIEEIIEIIEEVEECDEAVPDDSASKPTLLKDNETIERIERKDQSSRKELYSFDEEDSMFTSQPATKESVRTTSNSTPKTKQVINYDVDEDWHDEDLERADELENAGLSDNRAGSLQTDKKRVNNQTITTPLQSNKVDLRVHAESPGRSDKPQVESNIRNNVNMDSGETTHEIVKNVENNLLYTVLGTKKQDSSKQVQQDAHYVKVSFRTVL